MRAKVKALSGVLSGERAGVKVKPELLRQYREAGFQIVNRRVLVVKDPIEIASVRRGMPMLTRPVSQTVAFERIVLPFGARNARQLVEQIRETPERFNRLKGQNQYFGFKIFGNNSRQIFEDIELMADYLEGYVPLFDSINGDEYFESFELWRTNANWSPSPQRRRIRTEQDRREANEKRNRFIRMGRENYLAMDAERKRASRAKIKEAGDARYKNIVEADRKRQAERRKNPAYRSAEKLKDKVRKKAFRDQIKWDARNGYKPD